MALGMISGSGALLGALVGHFARPRRSVIGIVMGFGAGVLVAVLAFSLMEEAYQQAGTRTAVVGFVTGALVFVIGDLFIDRLGGEHRKRSHAMPHEINGNALWLGAALAVAAGAIMAMLADTMMPEAFSLTGNLVALATTVGFICAFCLSKLL